jgi:hypothetical protein
MTVRKAITGLLLASVAGSVGYLSFRSVKAAKEWRAPETVNAADRKPEPAAKGPGKVIAYYFHATVRCTTCRAIEAYSKEVIHQRFAQEIAAGQLEWRLVNIQTPENRHFIQDYQLFTKSLVLTLHRGGREEKFKVLNDTWELVGNKASMQTYVEKEVRAFLGKI